MIKSNVNARGKFGKTPLVYALFRYSDIEIIRLLLDRDADVNAAYINGNTALMKEAVYCEKRNNTALLDRGANVNAVNIDGRAALMKARNHQEIVDLLQSYERK